jgi:hypothetical protein
MSRRRVLTPGGVHNLLFDGFLDTDQNATMGIVGASGVDYTLDLWTVRMPQTLVQQTMPASCVNSECATPRRLAVIIATLRGPGGVRAVIAESLLLKQQLIVLSRARQRAPNLTRSDRLLYGF